MPPQSPAQGTGIGHQGGQQAGRPALDGPGQAINHHRGWGDGHATEIADALQAAPDRARLVEQGRHPPPFQFGHHGGELGRPQAGAGAVPIHQGQGLQAIGGAVVAEGPVGHGDGGALAVRSQGDRGQLAPVPAIQFRQLSLQGSRAPLNLGPTLWRQGDQLGCHRLHHLGRLGRIVPEVGILAIARAPQPLHDRHPVGNLFQGGGQAPAIDQQQAALGQELALGRVEPKRVGIVTGAQQAGHLDLAGRQPFRQIAENAIAGNDPDASPDRGGCSPGILPAAPQDSQQRQQQGNHAPSPITGFPAGPGAGTIPKLGQRHQQQRAPQQGP